LERKNNSEINNLLSNGFFRGHVTHLLPLNDAEELLLSFNNPHITIITLKTEKNIESGTSLKGNIIVYANNVENVVNKFPRNIDTLSNVIHVMFTGKIWNSRSLKKICEVRYKLVIDWLHWLIANNHLYQNIDIDQHFEQRCIDLLDENGVPRCLSVNRSHFEHDTSSIVDEQSGYVEQEVNDYDVQFHRICSIDPDPTLSESESLINLLRFPLYVHHHGSPINRFKDPFFFEKSFVSIFPYGVGGLSNHDRGIWVKHLFGDSSKSRIVQRNHR
jgi:hypothetical protein